MIFRSRGRCIVSLSFVCLAAAPWMGCGGDDQPPATGGVAHDSGSTDGTAATDGTLTDGTADGNADGGTDASTDAPHDAALRDVGPQPDAPIQDGDLPIDAIAGDASCGTKADLSVSPDAGVCLSIETYSCGVDQYEIDCNCPAATCTCQKNGSQVGSAVSLAGCPACSMPNYASIAAACGIPY